MSGVNMPMTWAALTRLHALRPIRGEADYRKASILRLAEHFGVKPGFFLAPAAARPKTRRRPKSAGARPGAEAV